MVDEDTSTLYDASLVVTVPAQNIEEADQIVDEIIEWLAEQGYEIEAGMVEESISIEE